MIPPKSKIFVGDGDFGKIGEEFKEYLVELAKLETDHKILDVGCGIGRMAIPLTDYLSPKGEYFGIDIVKGGIQWCSERITSKFNNFKFIHTDVYNKHYNPTGTFSPIDYEFPFKNEAFDVVFLTSVFTHMRSNEVENYLSEVSRVLRPGGCCLITFYIINDQSIDACRSGKAALDFKYEQDRFYTTNNVTPEAAIGYHQNYLENIFEANHLDSSEGIHYGSWSGRSSYLSFQDVVIARKI